MRRVIDEIKTQELTITHGGAKVGDWARLEGEDVTRSLLLRWNEWARFVLALADEDQNRVVGLGEREGVVKVLRVENQTRLLLETPWWRREVSLSEEEVQEILASQVSWFEKDKDLLFRVPLPEEVRGVWVGERYEVGDISHYQLRLVAQEKDVLLWLHNESCFHSRWRKNKPIVFTLNEWERVKHQLILTARSSYAHEHITQSFQNKHGRIMMSAGVNTVAIGITGPRYGFRGNTNLGAASVERLTNQEWFISSGVSSSAELLGVS